MSEIKQERARKKELAQHFYCNTNFTQKDIANKVVVSENTLVRWAKEGKWEQLKASLSITKKEQISAHYNQLAAINVKIRDEQNGIPMPADIDMQLKLAIIIEKLEKEISITDVVNVSIKIIEFVREVQPEKEKEYIALFDAYINSII